MTTQKLPITRTRIDGKRRLAIALTDLAKLAGKGYLWLELFFFKKLPFRPNIDYVYKDNRYLLTLATTQTMLALIDTEQAWSSYHRITDFLHNINQQRTNNNEHKQSKTTR